jgi:hypothetical protein
VIKIPIAFAPPLFFAPYLSNLHVGAYMCSHTRHLCVRAARYTAVYSIAVLLSTANTTAYS